MRSAYTLEARMHACLVTDSYHLADACTGSHILSAAEGQVCACESLALQIAPQPPRKILLSIQPGALGGPSGEHARIVQWRRNELPCVAASFLKNPEAL